MVDLLAVMEELRVTHPHHFDTLVRVPATFYRIHYERFASIHSTHEYIRLAIITMRIILLLLTFR